MMKKIILAIGLMFGGVAFVNAQQTQQQDTTSTQQSDQYRRDTTTTDDQQNQSNQDQSQSDSTSTQQSDMYRTEGNVSDSTSNNTDANTTNDTDAASNQTTTGTPAPTTTDDQMSSQNETGVTQDQDQEGEKIEVSELPAAVQTKLQSTDYQGWVVTSARKKMWSDPDNAQAPSKEVYVIEAKNGSDTKKLKFDKDGNEIEHDKDKKDDQK